MAKVYILYIGTLTVLALCKYCSAEWNSTDGSANRTVSQCHLHGDQDNCTEETGEWNGHFSKCPNELTYYCVHGECRYIKEQKTPSCRCQTGYIGSRCEYVNLDPQVGGRQQIIIACTITGLVLLMIVIVSICLCSHRRCRGFWWRRQREEARNGTEKVSMMVTSPAHSSLTADTTETTHTNLV